MNSTHWAIERRRMAVVLFLALLGGVLTGYWLLSLVVALLGYIGWLLFKLEQLYGWLQNGSSEQAMPNSSGVWGRVIQQTHNIKKKSSKRKRRTAKLLSRFQGIITGLPYATVVLNGKNEIDWANALALDYLSINIKADRGQRIENLIRIPEMHDTLASSGGSELEITIPQVPDRKLALQLIPVQSDLKLLIARDISERVQLQQARKIFVANASHELRTPLTVIAGYLEILQNANDIPRHLEGAIAEAAEQSSRMERIIDDLLTLSRLEQSDLDEGTTEIIEVPTLLEGICKDEVRMIENDSHSVHLSIDGDIHLRGAEAEIISVLSNLIHNAIRHTDAGTHVRVRWGSNEQRQACLTVEDDGHGIPAEHMSSLTKRFYRVDKGRSRKEGGTGLGLAIVQHIMQRHGGRLDIQSSSGKGAVFTACFPESRVISPD